MWSSRPLIPGRGIVCTSCNVCFSCGYALVVKKAQMAMLQNAIGHLVLLGMKQLRAWRDDGHAPEATVGLFLYCTASSGRRVLSQTRIIGSSSAFLSSSSFDSKLA